jgi:hypothetical protein
MGEYRSTAEVIKKVPKGDKKSKKRKSVDGVAAPDQAGKSPSKPKNKNKAKKTAAPNGAKKAKKGSGGAQPSTSPAKPRRNRSGSATRQPGPNGGFQVTVVQECVPRPPPSSSGPYTEGLIGDAVFLPRRESSGAPRTAQSPQKQAKKNKKRANAGLQVSPAIKKKKSGQSPARKAKVPCAFPSSVLPFCGSRVAQAMLTVDCDAQNNNNNQGQGKKKKRTSGGGAAAGGGGVTLNQRFSALKSARN